ncbi:glycoside hydrolase family 3 protein [Macrolepiota fuliginosa MF-IS2]|uniref:Glycoside hydrolase family 3 protein n=1 Tax=Macrolepiota fuliginosa MF-IS2 TaxID=1400762 RepID=A0A9P5X8F3_9AGAR|nr:glycoside hydrolase family 3 protein [Macrolepiota fuliginosa MF-IS2]
MGTLDEITRREIGQHLVLGFQGHEISDDVKSLISKYYVGNIILMKRNVRDAEQTRQLIKALQLLARQAGHERPLLIGIDQENGLVSAFSSPSAGTQFPGAMAQAAIDDIGTARLIASSCGEELKAVGINWTYGPVADVNINPLNPVIGVRSFGSDPKLVGEYATASGQSFVSSGVASCAKHFPGHGDTHVDSHLALPVINKTKQELSSGDLPPFQAVIAAGIPSIMTAHIALPLLTGDKTPASLSRAITTDLLRKELGYDGLIVTDCLEMDAISAVEKGGCGIEEGAVRAIIAGADIAMICHTYRRQVGALEQICAAVQNERISLAELKRSGERIAAMKDKFVGDWDSIFDGQRELDFTGSWKLLKERNLRLSLEAYRRSTTVVMDTGSLLPLRLSQNKEIVLLTPLRVQINKAVDGDDENTQPVRNTASPYDKQFVKILEGHGIVDHIVYGPDDSPSLKNEGINAVIFVTRNAFRAQWQWSVLKKALGGIGENVPVIVIASCDPYDFRLIDDSLPKDKMVFMSTHEFTAEAFAGAGTLIFG